MDAEQIGRGSGTIYFYPLQTTCLPTVSFTLLHTPSAVTHQPWALLSAFIHAYKHARAHALAHTRAHFHTRIRTRAHSPLCWDTRLLNIICASWARSAQQNTHSPPRSAWWPARGPCAEALAAPLRYASPWQCRCPCW